MIFALNMPEPILFAENGCSAKQFEKIWGRGSLGDLQPHFFFFSTNPPEETNFTSNINPSVTRLTEAKQTKCSTKPLWKSNSAFQS
jgi:hypothetical protein